MQSILPPDAALCCRQVQSCAAVQCNRMPPSTINKGANLIHAEGVRWRSAMYDFTQPTCHYWSFN